MIKLTLTEKGGEPKLLTFDKDEVTIGRVSGNDIVLAKGNVSKRHSKLVLRGGQIEVSDLKSTNGDVRERTQDRRADHAGRVRPGLRRRLPDRDRDGRRRRRGRERLAPPPAAAAASPAAAAAAAAAPPPRGCRPRRTTWTSGRGRRGRGRPGGASPGLRTGASAPRPRRRAGPRRRSPAVPCWKRTRCPRRSRATTVATTRTPAPWGSSRTAAARRKSSMGSTAGPAPAAARFPPRPG